LGFYEKRQTADIVAIRFDDSRYLTLPTPAPPDFHPPSNDFGSILIWIVKSKPGQTPETEAKMLKQSYSKENSITLLDDYEITVDGHNASILEYQYKEPMVNSYTLMFNRRIFFEVKDQIYQIHFSVAEKERGDGV